MAYMKTTLISKPVESSYGSIGDLWDSIKGGASSALNFFGAGIKAQGAQEALQAQLQAQQAQTQQSGISSTHLLIGGAAVAGLLVFAMRRK